jgi:hypothetical protein
MASTEESIALEQGNVQDEENHPESEEVDLVIEPTEEDVDPVIEPPPSSGETMRDWILRTLDRPFFQVLGAIVLLLVIGTGALFFFFLMGWQTVCRPRTDCEPRNWWYNWSIQALNVCFTYMATVSLPWRATNFIHTLGCGCPHRRNDVGHDLYGLPTKDIWFHVPLGRRAGILFVLILNCLTQYANQATRIKYYTYELQDASPGNIWTNVFFAASFGFAGIGGAWLVYEQGQVRKLHPPDTFALGPIDMGKKLMHDYFAKRAAAKKNDNVVSDELAATAAAETEDPTNPSIHYPDPTREEKRRSVIPANRSSMRLFGM